MATQTIFPRMNAKAADKPKPKSDAKAKAKAAKDKAKGKKRKFGSVPTGDLAPGRTAADFDKYELYGLSVQEPEHEVEFFDERFEERFGRKPTVLREDFCGTFGVCAEWVKLGDDRLALGVDLDPEPLDWGKKTRLPKLTKDQRKRLLLRKEDVRSLGKIHADVIAAQNFSFFCFKTRKELREYFEFAAANLNKPGILIADMMGGGECYTDDQEDVRKVGSGRKAFKYVWETESFDPISHHCRMHIGFRFADGTAKERTFTYDWRFWTLPEIRELMYEAGFRKVDVYWEGDDPDTDEGNGEFTRVESGTADPAWICYVVAEK
ncbi:MAG: class I SAM-dependent methyltransferase [Planctomycetota bacterium]